MDSTRPSIRQRNGAGLRATARGGDVTLLVAGHQAVARGPVRPATRLALPPGS
jgi:hypothetical protein